MSKDERPGIGHRDDALAVIGGLLEELEKRPDRLKARRKLKAGLEALRDAVERGVV
jgi:hypothetical protein